MLKLKKDFECVLRDANTGEDLLTFYAQQVGDPNHTASFVGGGVASGSQSFSILVDQAYQPDNTPVDNLAEILNPLEQEVIINGHKWLLTSFAPSIRRRLGAGWANKPKTVYVLNLE